MERLFRKMNLDMILISNISNLKYFIDTEYELVGTLLCIPRKSRPFIITYPLEENRLRTLNYKVYPTEKKGKKFMRLTETLSKVINTKKMKVGTDSKITKKYFKKVVDVSKNILEIRSIKTNKEVKRMKKAASLADKAFTMVKKILKPGIKELDVVGKIENFLRSHGIETLDFIIVAFGKNSSFSHHKATQKKLKKNEFILIDIGFTYKSYFVDMSRTFCIKPSDKQKIIYDVVKEAQELAFKNIKIGQKVSEVDKLVVDFLKKKGFTLPHALGHGVGIDVHERPLISQSSKNIFRKNMVMAIEPAVYIPKYGGVRIEDICLLTKKGIKQLTKFPKNL